MDEQQKLLVIGRGSPNDKNVFDEVNIEGKSIRDHFASQEIGVYHHPNNGNPLTTSIHRTTQDALAYAHDMQRIVGGEDHRLACVLYGGLAFAMPGVVAAEAPNIPVVAVASDEDAFYNVYKIPDGTPVGVVGISRLEQGILMAERILSLEPGSEVNFIVRGNCPSAEGVRKLLYGLVGNVQEVESYRGNLPGVTVCLAEKPGHLAGLDEKVRFGIFGVEKTNPSMTMIEPLEELSNSVVIGRPKNLALYAARVAGLTDPDVRGRLTEYRKKEAQGYPKRVPMELGHFK